MHPQFDPKQPDTPLTGAFWKKRHDLLAAVLDTAGVLVVVLDRQGRIVFFNRASKQTTGYTTREIKGCAIGDILLLSEEVGSTLQIFERLLAGESPITHETFWLTKQGTPRLIAWTSTALHDGAGEVEYLVGTGMDITERQQAERDLRESETRFRTLAEQSPDIIYIVEHPSKRPLYLNRDSLLGYSVSELEQPQEALLAVHPEEREELRAHWQRVVDSGTDIFEFRLRDKEGQWEWVQSRKRVLTRGSNGKPTQILGHLTLITARKDAEAQLRHNALYDSLTELPNRTLFLDRLTQALEPARREPPIPFAVLCLDLDRFKVINDSLGHALGDHLLVTVARRLELCLPPGDTLARLGGDEFVLLVEGVERLSEITHLAERIRQTVAEPFALRDHTVYPNASIGITLSTTNYDRAGDVLRDAEIAMYRAKSLGRGHYAVFDQAMHAYALTLLRMEVDLRQAIEQEQFCLYYQPIVSLVTGQIVAVEALLRWNHPQRGLVSPAEFITLAEETGLIVPIGEWVLREACKQGKIWGAKGLSLLCLSVNLSGCQLKQANIVEMVERVLRETGWPPTQLKLELTESVIMENAESSIKTLQALNDLGIGISIDDFGMGYSSLSYLQRFPIDTLKIDRSFIRDVTLNSGDAAITTAIIALARSLKLSVLPEGVETEEQLRFIQAQRCDEMQGFLFSRPVPPEQIANLLREGRSLFNGNGRRH